MKEHAIRIRSFGVLTIVFLISIFALFGCSSNSESNSNASSDSESVEVEAVQEEVNPIQIDGIYHTLTGINEPTAFSYDAKNALIDAEEKADKKVLYVAVSVTPDERENIHVGSKNGNLSGGTVSDAKLVIDDINEYGDDFGLNKSGISGKTYYPQLLELGYHDGSDQDELLGGSEEPYRAIFLFFLSNADFEKGEVGYFTWGDFSTEIDMSTIKTVDTPLDMVADLATLQ